ncbi:MAG: hypothetical protein Q8N51_16955, partial [Gammaproteobacteria bacterium]|nr:hypothetical protein [Gammaproteobacteria bacterium]
MNKMPRLKVGISGLLAGILLLTVPALAADAANDLEQTAAAGSSAAMYSLATPWDKYLSSTRVQREIWLKNAGREVPPDLVNRFRRAGDGLRLL